MKVNIEIVSGTRKEPKDHCVKHCVVIYDGVQQNEKTLSGRAVVLKKARKGVYRYEVIKENKFKLKCLTSQVISK